MFNPKDELPQTFEYVDLESVVGTEMLSHRTEIKSSAPSRAQRLACTGDIFYQTVRPYQKNNYLFEISDNNYVFSTGYAQMRPFVDGYFLFSLIQSERFVKVVLDILFVIGLAVKMTVQTYAVVRGILGFLFTLLIIATAYCYHDWVQVAFLFVLSTILYLILFAGVVVDTVLDMTRESIIDFILS